MRKNCRTATLTSGATSLPSLLLFAAALFISGCSKQGGGSGTAGAGGGGQRDANRVIIVSPHDDSIKHELTPAFEAWYAKKYPGKPAPQVEWQDRGGSVEINKYLISSYAALGSNPDKGVGIDLYFGGGTPAHAQLKEKNISQPVELDPAIIGGIPKDLAGVAMLDPDKRWFGVVLSSFGIMYNKTGLRAKGLNEPKTWSDLDSPGYFNTLVLADPAKSGSSRVCYEVILQKFGWEAGWAQIMQMAGNTREFATGSGLVPREISQGSALAGVCVDYYALAQMAQTDSVGYVSPLNATAITPDPIGMLRGAPHPELAKAFIEFTLSLECQNLFGLKAGVPGGPKVNLFRMPILPAFYEAQHATGSSLFTTSPYASASSFNINEKLGDQRAPLLGPLFAAAFLNNKQLLQQARQVVIARPNDRALAAKFEAVPFTAAQALEYAGKYVSSPREAIQLDREWQQTFEKRYKEIIEAGK